MGVGLEQDRSWGGAGPAAPVVNPPGTMAAREGVCLAQACKPLPRCSAPCTEERGGLRGSERATPPAPPVSPVCASLPQPTSQTPGLQGSAATLHPHPCCRVRVCGCPWQAQVTDHHEGTWAPLAAQGAEPGFPESAAPAPLHPV